MEMQRAILVLVPLLGVVFAAPMPYYTRSFVQTPTSRVEQFLIMPDKNSPHRVPLSQVHHYSDFQFPRQQLLYYHPDGHNQHLLHEMKKDHPVMQQMMKDLKIDEAMMADEMMKSSTDSNMMKRDDGIMTEMMDALKEATDAPKAFDDAIVVADVADENPTEAPPVNVEMVKAVLKIVESSPDALKSPELMEMMKKILEIKENVEEISTTAHPLMTEAIVSSADAQSNEELAEMLRSNQLSEEKMTRIADLIANVEQITTEAETAESSTARMAKVLALEIVEETKNEPEIELRLVADDSETSGRSSEVFVESSDVSTSTESSFDESTASTEAPTVENSSTVSEVSSTSSEVSSTETSEAAQLAESSTEASEEIRIATEEAATESSIADPITEISRMELIRSMLESVERLEEKLSQMQRILPEASTEASSEIPESFDVTSSESPAVEISEKTTEISEESTTSSSEQSTESAARAEDSTVKTEAEATETARAEEREPIIESTTEAAAQQTTTLKPNEEVADENSPQNANELRTSAVGESEATSDEEISPQRVNTRQGRINSAPTIFLHNNRFYMVSGAPEFYANFDASYQSLRTPIFSLQELTPIRPIDKNTPVQRIEPFRVFADGASEEEADDGGKATGTQNDNEREENEPLKLQSDGQDKRSDIESGQSMLRNVERRGEAKKGEHDRQPAGEAEVERDLSEESSVAQANPSGIAISGRGGVASSRPSGTALVGNQGLAVASPQATAVAGLSVEDDEDRKKLQMRRLRRFRKY